MTPRACMGGFCGRRDACQRYLTEGPEREFPAERLCAPGVYDAFEQAMLWPPRSPAWQRETTPKETV